MIIANQIPVRRMVATRRISALLLAVCLFLQGCTETRQQNLIQSGDELLSQNKPKEAAELFRKAISVNPESKVAIKAIYKLGNTLETYLSDAEGALFNYNEFIRLSQDRVGLYEVQKRIAKIYFENYRDPEKAIAAYKKLISFNSESLEVDLFQFRIAQSYFRQNNFEQARLEYQQLISQFPKSQYVARARYEIGNSYFMESKYDIAQEALKQVLRYHPQSEFAPEAQFLMGQCLEHRNELQEALQLYESIEGRYSSPEVLTYRIQGLKKRLSKEAKKGKG